MTIDETVARQRIEDALELIEYSLMKWARFNYGANLANLADEQRLALYRDNAKGIVKRLKFEAGKGQQPGMRAMSGYIKGGHSVATWSELDIALALCRHIDANGVPDLSKPLPQELINIAELGDWSAFAIVDTQT